MYEESEEETKTDKGPTTQECDKDTVVRMIERKTKRIGRGCDGPDVGRRRRQAEDD